jgi:signal transduction histidine kinase
VWHWPHLDPEDFPRHAAAKRAGVRSGLAIPLRAGSQVVAILELFGDEDAPPTSEQQSVLATLGPLLGEHLARRRAERHVGEQKEAFVATVSHELRTPLTAIVGAAQTAIQYGDQLDADRLREFLELILGQSRRLMRMVEDLLRMSALQSRAILPSVTSVDLHDAAREALFELGIEDIARVEAPSVEGDALARADRDLFKQVVVNLVQNADRYGEPPIVVAFDRVEGDLVRMRVSDRGVGVEEPFIPQLFEKFSRGAAGATKSGTGLGLAIVREIVRAMGGRVRYEANTPRGACFVVELPSA